MTVFSEVKNRVSINSPEEAKKILYKALFGQRTESITFLTNVEVTDSNEKAFHVLKYIDLATELVAEDLSKIGEKDNKAKNYYRSQYDYLCELTHPNYMALSMFWGVSDKKGEFIYETKIRREFFGMLLHIISPLLPLYMLYLKRAQKFEKDLLSKRQSLT